MLNLRREWARNARGARAQGGEYPVSAGSCRLNWKTLSGRSCLTEKRGLAHQCHVLLLMQMLADGDPLPTLSDLLEEYGTGRDLAVAL